MAARQAFGVEGLDAMLGGGLLPGTLTVVAGATGAGKTQLGLRWADLGLASEGRRGVICDLTSRGDAQNHEAYARDQFGWDLVEHRGRRAGRPRADLGLRPRPRRLLPPVRPLGPTGHPARPGARRLARLEVRPGPGPPGVGRVLLLAVRPGLAPGGGRRDRADRAVRRVDPVRVLRVPLSAGLPEGGRVGRPRGLSRTLPGQRRGRPRPPIRPQVHRLPLPLHHAPRPARRPDGPADRRGGHPLQRQHDHPTWARSRAAGDRTGLVRSTSPSTAAARAPTRSARTSSPIVAWRSGEDSRFQRGKPFEI